MGTGVTLRTVLGYTNFELIIIAVLSVLIMSVIGSPGARKKKPGDS